MKHWQPLGLAVALVAGLWLGRRCGPEGVPERLIDSGFSFHGSVESRRLLHVLGRIENMYVDSFDPSRLVDAAIAAMLDELDPHTVYFSGEELAEMSESMEGNFEGIGVEFLIQKDTLMVVSAIPGGPSEAAGILAGDRILEVDGKAISGSDLTNRRVMELLKGPRGTSVNLGLSRRGLLSQVRITRDRIPIESVVAAFVAEEGVGYIKVIRFAATTAMEFEEAMAFVASQGAHSIIVDLRGNGGGYLNAVVDMVELFLREDQTIVYTQGNASPRRDYTCRRTGPYVDWPLAVLVDEGSASASEIFAGAVQDNDRGWVVGRRTFGKGLVQEEFAVPGDGALRLTVARFYTPTGRAIQKPYATYEDDFDVRLTRGELYHADSMPLVDSLRYTTPMGREVFGGGGIAPDLFVPWDSTATSAWVGEWLWTGVLRDAVFAWMDNHRESLSACTHATHVEALPAWNLVEGEVRRQAEAQGMSWQDPSPEELAKLRHRFLAQVVRTLWGESASYEILMAGDAGVAMALHVLLEDEMATGNDHDVSLDLTHNESHNNP
ncbi:MAG: S41 family peptidase [Bacteroidetes bacterium]|nr:S41 family peptidase [Bacteroidota bacterium]MDA0903402.1 S41 family peptidase [Bacteroidota bacterium]